MVSESNHHMNHSSNNKHSKTKRDMSQSSHNPDSSVEHTTDEEYLDCISHESDNLNNNDNSHNNNNNNHNKSKQEFYLSESIIRSNTGSDSYHGLGFNSNGSIVNSTGNSNSSKSLSHATMVSPSNSETTPICTIIQQDEDEFEEDNNSKDMIKKKKKDESKKSFQKQQQHQQQQQPLEEIVNKRYEDLPEAEEVTKNDSSTIPHKSLSSSSTTAATTTSSSNNNNNTNTATNSNHTSQDAGLPHPLKKRLSVASRLKLFGRRKVSTS